MKKNLLISLIILLNSFLFLTINSLSSYYEKVIRVELINIDQFVDPRLVVNDFRQIIPTNYIDFIIIKIKDRLLFDNFIKESSTTDLNINSYLKSLKFSKIHDVQLKIIIRNQNNSQISLIDKHIQNVIQVLLDSDLYKDKYRYFSEGPNDKFIYISNMKQNLLFFFLIIFIEIYFIILFRRQLAKFFKLNNKNKSLHL